MLRRNIYDLIIIGGGVAGLSAGIYAGRGKVKTLIIDNIMLGGQPNNYESIENYPSYPSINGCDLSSKLVEHVKSVNSSVGNLIDVLEFENITRVKIKSGKKYKYIITDSGNVFVSKAVIIATGATHRKLNVPGESGFFGKGVSYCALCDAHFCKGKKVTVIGGGNSALEEAMYLSKYAKEVNILVRSTKLRADKVVVEKLLNTIKSKNSNIYIYYSTIPVEIIGGKHVTHLDVVDSKAKIKTRFETDFVFPYLGVVGNTSVFYSDLNSVFDVEFTEDGFIKVDDRTLETGVKGVFAVGDVRNTPLRQVVMACADGALGAVSALKYLESN